MSVVDLKSISGITSITTPASDNQLTLHTNNTTERLRITSAGLVGINSTVPQATLDVYGDNTSAGGLIQITQDGTGDAAIDFQLKGTREYSLGIDNSDSDKFKLSGSAGLANNTLLTVTNSGSVGINTSSPNGQFHIHQSSAGSVTAATDANDLVIESSTNVGMSLLTANDSQARIKFGDPDATNAGAFVYNHTNDKFSIVTGTGNRMIIGADMISARTDYGVARTAGGYTFRETNEGGERAGMHSDASNNLLFKTGSASEKLRIDSSGNICGAGGIINLKHTSATGNVNVNMLGVSGDSRLDLENTGDGNYSGIDFVRERASGAGVVGGAIFMKSDTSNNLAHLYIQAQSASAQSPVTSALAANNGVRLLLEGGSGKFGVSTGDSERFVINGAGDVLIPGNQATSNETGKLDIYHAADDDINNPHIRLWGAGNNDARIEFGSPTNVGEGGYISYNDADEGLYIGSRMGAYSEVNLCTGMNDGSPHTKIRLSVKADGRVMTEVQNGRGGIGMVGAFMARVAAVYDFAAGTRKIVMTNEEFDANGWYDASNSRYTPLCKGWYQMHFHLQFKTGLNNNSVEMQLYPYFNGAALPGPVQGWDNNHGNYAYNSWSTIMYFDGVDDYVELYGNCSHTTDVATATHMMGFLVYPVT